jgi:probable phosphoglycerate mutase
MFIYLVRHGKDDDTVRGGWSQCALTTEGMHQVAALTDYIGVNANLLKIRHIYSSDLPRALQTAQPIADKLGLKIVYTPQFREVNNGVLAGMKNDVALLKYPNLFWNQLDWDQCYPEGESPKEFYERIHNAWLEFSKRIALSNENVVLVTHGGVINVIRAIIEYRKYNNREKHKSVNYTEFIKLSYENDKWHEVQ